MVVAGLVLHILGGQIAKADTEIRVVLSLERILVTNRPPRIQTPDVAILNAGYFFGGQGSFGYDFNIPQIEDPRKNSHRIGQFFVHGDGVIVVLRQWKGANITSSNIAGPISGRLSEIAHVQSNSRNFWRKKSVDPLIVGWGDNADIGA